MESVSSKKYEIIIDDILNQIKRNDFSYTTPICTEKQLSLTYNVSRITAKRAITELEQRGILYRKRGVGSFVAQEGLTQYDSLLKKDSSPPPSADSKNFAFLIPYDDITKSGLLETIEIVNASLFNTNYCMSIYISGNNVSNEKNILVRLLKQNISGLIYYPLQNNYNLDLLNTLIISGKPVIIIDKSSDCPYVHNIISDNYNGGEQLANHLISLGHRNIAFLSYASMDKTTSVRDRFGGLLCKLREAGISLNPDFVLNQISSIIGGNLETSDNPQLISIIQKLYKGGVTAIVAENDQFAYYIYMTCKEMGLRVPEDISICGFDNTDWSTKGDASITTIRQDFKEFGRNISKILLDSISTPNIPIQKITIPVSLIARESCAPTRQ
jgi:GntR family transcriptional regulator, arabinose operon transcriptional repressor